MNRKKIPLISIIVSLVVILAVYTLVSNMSHSLWADEGDTLRIATQASAKDVIYSTIKYRPYPPLYFLVVNQSLKFRNDEVGLRLPSMIFGLLSVYAVFLLGRVMLGETTGLLAALIFLLTPGVFRWFVDGNAYMMLVCFTTLSSYALFQALMNHKLRHWVAYVVFSVISLAVHSLAVFHVISHFVCALLYYRLHENLHFILSVQDIRKFWKRTRPLLISVLSIASIWILWGAFYLKNGGMTGQHDISRIFSINVIYIFAILIYGFFLKAPLQLALAPFLQLAGSASLYSGNRQELIFLLTLLVLPVALITLFVTATLGYPIYRYAIGAFPFTCILAAAGIRSWVLQEGRAENRRTLVIKGVIPILIAGYLLSGVHSFVFPGEDLFEYQDWKGTAQFVESHAGDDDIFVFYPGFGSLSYLYYHKPGTQKFFVNYPVRQEKGLKKLVDIVNKKLNHEAGQRTIWIITGFQSGVTNPLKKYFFGDIGPVEMARRISVSITSTLKAHRKDISIRTHYLKRVIVTSVRQS